MPRADVPAFMIDLGATEGTAAKALAFTIYCATRTSETIEARWSEIDGDVWSIPAGRTKTGKLHRVPLSTQAFQILKGAAPMATPTR